MLKKAYLFLALVLPFIIYSQEDGLKVGEPATDTVALSSKKKPGIKKGSVPTTSADTVATIAMYKIISIARDTTVVDTSLTIQKHYTVNYLRKDNFGLLPLSNEGQPYNVLDYGMKDYTPFPEFGFRGKHFAYLNADDISYYNVATPFTDLFYRSVIQQGQVLDAFITLNTSPNLNFAVAYKGLRSLGKYINQLSSNGNFRFITSYDSPGNRYHLKLHFTAQDFTNQENGGIVSEADFESGEDPFTQRERLDVFFRDATSILKGNRYFFDHSFRVSKDNPNSIVVNHRFKYENKFFEYNQNTASALFGPSYRSTIYNKTRFNTMYNKLGIAYSSERLGAIEFFVEDYNYNYYYKRIVFNDDIVPNSIGDRINTYGARYGYQAGKWKGTIGASNSITDQSLANIDVSARYALNDETHLSARYQNMNKLPDLNFRLYQSDYVHYNWINDFKNEKINSFEVEAKTKWLTASAQYTVLNDHLFFKDNYEAFGSTVLETIRVSPQQYEGTINYFAVKAGREFKWWKLALDNTVLYQKVDQGSKVLNVPEFVTRNTLYFSDHFFKRALFLQTGFTFQYFTEYYGNSYNPLLGEFYSQDRRKIGGYPLLDFFVNAKIQQFRVFINAEHFNSGFTGYNFYSAPNYPYRDFTIRFGIIWDFFS